MRYWIPEGGLFPKSYAIGIQANGLLSESQLLLLHPLPFTVLWTPGDGLNRAYAANSPADAWTAIFTQIDGSTGDEWDLAELDIPLGEHAGTFTNTSETVPTITLPAGDLLVLRAPASPDPSLGNLAVTLLLQRL